MTSTFDKMAIFQKKYSNPLVEDTNGRWGKNKSHWNARAVCQNLEGKNMDYQGAQFIKIVNLY